MKKWLAMLLCVAMLLSFAACAEQGGTTPDKGSTGNNKKESPEEYFSWDGDMIYGLTDEGKKQKSLVVPSRCKAFEVGAFRDAVNLEEIVFVSDSLRLVKSLFSGCTSLKSVSIPAGQTEIPAFCFAYCESLVSIDLPAGITSIGESAFYLCKGLKTINLEDTAVTNIGASAFESCETLSNAAFPATLTSIEKYAFAYCKGMATADFQSGIQSIGDYAFHQCEALSKVTLPETLTSLGEHALSYCTKLAEIYLPASLTEFHVSSFAKTVMADDVVILTVYVKEGSKADTEFDNYNDGQMEKKYY